MQWAVGFAQVISIRVSDSERTELEIKSNWNQEIGVFTPKMFRKIETLLPNADWSVFEGTLFWKSFKSKSFELETSRLQFARNWFFLASFSKFREIETFFRQRLRQRNSILNCEICTLELAMLMIDNRLSFKLGGLSGDSLQNGKIRKKGWKTFRWKNRICVV